MSYLDIEFGVLKPEPPTPWARFFALLPRKDIDGNWTIGRCAARYRFEIRFGGDSVTAYIQPVREYATFQRAAIDRLKGEP